MQTNPLVRGLNYYENQRVFVSFRDPSIWETWSTQLNQKIDESTSFLFKGCDDYGITLLLNDKPIYFFYHAINGIYPVEQGSANRSVA